MASTALQTEVVALVMGRTHRTGVESQAAQRVVPVH